MVEKYIIAIENILKKMEENVAPRKKRISAIRNILRKIGMDYKELERLFEQVNDEHGNCLKVIIKQRRKIDELKKELEKLKNRME